MIIKHMVMAILDMVHTRILRSAIMEKRMDSLNIDLLVFRTKQFIVMPKWQLIGSFMLLLGSVVLFSY